MITAARDVGYVCGNIRRGGLCADGRHDACISAASRPDPGRISAVSRLYLGCISRSYEVNIEYVPKLEAKGMQFVGRDTTGERMEVHE